MRTVDEVVDTEHSMLLRFCKACRHEDYFVSEATDMLAQMYPPEELPEEDYAELSAALQAMYREVHPEPRE